ncbi:uncharacterized protein F4812DRAFT_460968 [Daldinia caldariorum]|uniref:uncharacterized protein n=1 Tax=Daldinia caldariorum TaxID=326644 RepID=UPI002007ADDD|nr:uncharacterized protein F4812DRAFT_460968 [Daldinia caldariorum]KAI1465988.1 hypothetical protein F4812DRAFT_460968 [Daldinia caldariorum]
MRHSTIAASAIASFAFLQCILAPIPLMVIGLSAATAEAVTGAAAGPGSCTRRSWRRSSRSSSTCPRTIPPPPPTAPEGVPQFNVDACYRDALNATVTMTGPVGENHIRVEGLPQTCMVLSMILGGTPHGPQPVPCGNACIEFAGMTVDGIWVLLVFHLVNYDIDDPDGDMDVSRKDGQSLIARFVRLYDVVHEGRIERRQKILERLPVILKEGDIDCVDVPGRWPVFMSQDKIPMLHNRSHESGVFIHMIVEHLFERLEGIIQDKKNPARGTIRRRLHNLYENRLWAAIRLPMNAGILHRARGRMIGNIMTGMSVTNQWQATAAIEVPFYTIRASNGLTSALDGLNLADDGQSGENEGSVSNKSNQIK